MLAWCDDVVFWWPASLPQIRSPWKYHYCALLGISTAGTQEAIMDHDVRNSFRASARCTVLYLHTLTLTKLGNSSESVSRYQV
jgi:hypothetical protein